MYGNQLFHVIKQLVFIYMAYFCRTRLCTEPGFSCILWYGTFLSALSYCNLSSVFEFYRLGIQMQSNKFFVRYIRNRNVGYPLVPVEAENRLHTSFSLYTGTNTMIADFVLQHWYCFTLPLGAVSLAGAAFNWNWLCAPASKADAERYTRGTRRLIYSLQGLLLLAVSIWGVIAAMR